MSKHPEGRGVIKKGVGCALRSVPTAHAHATRSGAQSAAYESQPDGGDRVEGRR
jgi:hypothetical protein